MSTSGTLTALALLMVGCAATPKPRSQAQAQVHENVEVTTTRTALTSADLPPGAGFEPLTPTISIEKAIADACRLHVSDSSKTAKFDYDESELLPSDVEALRLVAACLTTGALRGREIKLVGRADPRGTERYNQTLGAHRSRSVAAFLEQFGVDKARVHETSRGELDSTGTDEASWKTDRRVDIVLI
jgi:peptidoglycan-associated lipoprotein